MEFLKEYSGPLSMLILVFTYRAFMYRVNIQDKKKRCKQCQINSLISKGDLLNQLASQNYSQGKGYRYKKISKSIQKNENEIEMLIKEKEKIGLLW
jgi:hypothetical protein